MNKLKENIAIISSIVLFILICLLTIYIAFNYEENYYTKIDENHVSKLEISNNKYIYKAKCYNKLGRLKELTLKTDYDLTRNDYVKVKVKINGIYSIEEITYEYLPNKVKIKILK